MLSPREYEIFEDSDLDEFTEKLDQQFSDDVDRAKLYAISAIRQIKKKTKILVKKLENEKSKLTSENSRIKRIYDEQRNMFYKELSLLRNYVTNFCFIFRVKKILQTNKILM